MTEAKKEKRKKESAATQLLEFVVASDRKKFGPFSLFHDPHDRAFARYQTKYHVEIWPVKSSKFKKILARLYTTTRAESSIAIRFQMSSRRWRD